MNKLYFIPAFIFFAGAPAWGIAAAHVGSHFLAAELLIAGFIQIGVALGYVRLALTPRAPRGWRVAETSHD